MNQKKEVKLDELFVIALYNSKQPFRRAYSGIGQLIILYDKWYTYMESEFGITHEASGIYYYTDEQLLGMFILKWS